jgi:hypothetical protein
MEGTVYNTVTAPCSLCTADLRTVFTILKLSMSSVNISSPPHLFWALEQSIGGSDAAVKKWRLECRLNKVEAWKLSKHPSTKNSRLLDTHAILQYAQTVWITGPLLKLHSFATYKFDKTFYSSATSESLRIYLGPKRQLEMRWSAAD